MKFTKMKQIEIIDQDVFKIGDKLNLYYEKENLHFEVEILDVHENYLKGKVNGNIIYKIPLEELKKYKIEKIVENNLSKFKVGERYKVEDKLSGDTYNAEVIALGIDMVLKSDSGKHTVVQESQIGNVLLFTKLGNDTLKEESNKKEINENLSKEECEKKTDDFAKEFLNALYPFTNKYMRPLFSEYNPQWYFNTNCDVNNNANRYV